MKYILYISPWEAFYVPRLTSYKNIYTYVIFRIFGIWMAVDLTAGETGCSWIALAIND